VQFLCGEKELIAIPTQPSTAHRIRDESDFSEVKGQYHVRRAVEVAGVLIDSSQKAVLRKATARKHVG
jgi:predicted ATPase with chaperone activity